MSDILNYISAFSILLPVGAGLLHYGQYVDFLRWLTVFFVISAFFDLALAVTNYFGIHNLFLFHVFALVNLLFLAGFYYLIFDKKIVRQLLVGTAFFILLLALARSAQVGSWQQFPSFSITLQGILFIFLALLYFYQLVRRQTLVPIERQPLFWINAGVLLYFSGNLFLFMLQSRLGGSEHAAYNAYWVIHSIVNTIANVLYAVGFLCKPPRLT